MPSLHFLTGPRRGQQIELERGMVLGRGALADLDLGDAAVSRRHAMVSLSAGGCLLSDLQSGNGTFVNGERVAQPVRLSHGDKISLGQARLEFQDERTKRRDSLMDARVAFDEVAVDVSTSIALPVPGKPGRPTRATDSPELRLLRERLDFFSEVAEILSHTLDETALLNEILRRLMVAMPRADRTFIVLYDEATGEFEPKVARTRAGGAVQIPASRTLLRDAVKSRRAILSADATQDQRYAAGTVRELGIRSVICVPLLAGEHIYGALQVDNGAHARPFTEADLEALAGIALPIALSLANARLHQQLLAKQLMERDLELARRIQRQFLPRDLPAWRGFRFAAEYTPALQVGGDLYSFVMLPDGRLGIAVGDVSGKGVSAALLMARAISDLRYLASQAVAGDGVLGELNRSMLADDREGMFLTLIYLCLDFDTGALELWNAGHLRPLLRSASGSVRELAVGAGPPLGVDPAAKFPATSARIGPGETLVLYSDGLTEAMDESGGQFGMDRLRAAVSETVGEPQAVLGGVLRAVHEFLGAKGSFADDLTLVCVGRE
jgi:phosphoserine phosphatase RsbU/P